MLLTFIFNMRWSDVIYRVGTRCTNPSPSHHDDVIMGTMASQITSPTIVYSFYSGADQRKHQSSASLALVRGIHRGPVNFLLKWPVTRKMFPFDDVFMCGVLLCKLTFWGEDIDVDCNELLSVIPFCPGTLNLSIWIYSYDKICSPYTMRRVEVSLLRVL